MEVKQGCKTTTNSVFGAKGGEKYVGNDGKLRKQKEEFFPLLGQIFTDPSSKPRHLNGIFSRSRCSNSTKTVPTGLAKVLPYNLHTLDLAFLIAAVGASYKYSKTLPKTLFS